MNIEQQIYKELLKHAKGNQSKIEGISQPTLIAMKNGKGNTTFSNVFKALFDNGIETMVLKSKHTEMIFDATGKKLTVTTKKIEL